MVSAVLLFVLGLILLIKGGDWFVDGATGIALDLHIPELLIGATIVSIGTTLPEVMVSATSAIEGHGELAYGNAIGSIICNTALIAAITVAVMPCPVKLKELKIPVIFFFLAAVFYSIVAYTTGFFSRITGLILLATFVVYITISTLQVKKKKEQDTSQDVPQSVTAPDVAVKEESVCIPSDNSENAIDTPDNDDDESSSDLPLWKELFYLVFGAALIAVGANLLVNNGTIIATELGVPESVIALTFVALGTSLPELVTAITSLVKGHGSLSLGNVIGANLFNLVLVVGFSSALAPFSIPQNLFMNTGLNTSLVLEIPLMFAVMLILIVPSMITKKLSRWQGILLLGIYATFCVMQFVL